MTSPTPNSAAVDVGRVIVPTDLSDTSIAACAPAVRWARAHDAKVSLVHVVESMPLVAYAPLEGTYADLAGYHEQAFDRAAELLKERAADLSAEHAVEIEPHVEHGIPSECIAAYAESFENPWIVLTATGRSGLEHVLLGSTAERVARLATCPVFAVGRTPEAEREGEGGKILVGTDLSPASLETITLAKAYADARKAQLDVVTVLDDSLRYYLANFGLYPAVDSETFYLDSKREAAARLETEIERRLGGTFDGELIIRQGRPGHQIAAVAREGNYECVVVTSHGRTGWRRAIMGSVAEFVLRTAPCDVIVTHARVDDEATN